MPNVIRKYVYYVEKINRFVGRCSMYLVFVMMAVLLYAALSRSVFDIPLIWAVEVAQMLLAAYYLLGGAYATQLDSHVRMDLLYGRWSQKTRAIVDVVTSLFLLFYILILLYGSVSSTQYAIEYGQKNYSAWGPYMWPIKVTMTIGIFLMLLQVIATFFKDLEKAKGEKLS